MNDRSPEDRSRRTESVRIRYTTRLRALRERKRRVLAGFFHRLEDKKKDDLRKRLDV